MAPLRAALLATSLLSSTIRADEEKDPQDGISLLQALSVKGVARTDKKSVGALLETAGTLLKNGATEDVIEFARATLEEISGIVIPAIRDASEADQRLLDFMYAQFETALAELESGNQRINQLNQERSALSTQHKHCRDQEALFCVDKRECDYHLWDLWKIFVEEERDLRIIEGSIDGHFCVQDADGYYIANGTTFHFRDTSVPYMTSFITQKVRVDTAEEHYDDYVPQCEHKWTVLDEKTDVCDALQLNLERAACTHAEAIQDVQNTFAEAWNHALFSYNLTVHEVKLQEIDRISEYRTLSVVQCLLDRTSERNGRPCEESTDEITTEVTHCEEVRVTTDITWLELTYHVVVPHPHPCPDRHQVVGRCWPEVPPYPCQAQYITEEYGSLPDVPMPVFSETNSHCNPRPDCESCTGIGDEPDVHLCTSQWSLTHYELCADNTVTPAPPPSNNQAPPAVCPAGWEQKGAAGADIGGCGLQSCDDRYGLSSETACAARCDEHSACVGFSYAPMNGDRNHPGETACTIYNSDAPTGTWTGTQGIATQVFCGRPAATECGDLPQLTHASWVSSLDGAHQYRCDEGYSFDSTVEAQALTFEVECQEGGMYSEVHTCLPIDDCCGHSCGAFGTCHDLHMDYSCDCMEGYEMTTTETGEKICGNVDDCDGNLCGEAGVCVDLVSDYECHCQEGWSQVVIEITNVKTCERVECGDAPQIDHVVSTTSDIWSSTSSGIFPWTRGKAVFGDTVEYTCAPGYTTTGLPNGPRTFSILCQADGTYTDPLQCIPISCGVPEPAGGATPLTTDVVHFGDAPVEYNCPVGHGPDLFQRMCLENGHFSPVIACEPKLCPPAPVLAHASSPTGTDGLYFFGQVAEYRCLPGYSLTHEGPSEQTFEMECSADGWDITTGGCVPVQCEVVPDESHRRNEPWIIYHNSFNIVACADGYTEDGSAGGATELPLTCDPNGVADLQSCRIVTCSGSDLEEASNADWEIQDYPLGSSATYTCHEGHAVALTFAATFEVQCLRTGLFSALSTCRNIDDCEGHSCGSNGHCVDGINDYTCDCEEGFEEVEKECGNIDDCGPNACGGHGACHDLVNGYMCECVEGYELQGEGTEQLCVPVTCPPPDLENLAEPVPEMHFPETLFVACATGHDLGGASGAKTMNFFMIACSAEGHHTSRGSTELPQCRPTVCGQPPDVGGVLAEVRDYVYTEIATTTCQGDDVVITHLCEDDGTFTVTSEYSTCRNPCNHIDEAGNLLAGPVGATITGGVLPVYHPDSLEFTCEEGFTPLESGEPGHPITQACQANGEFESLPAGLSHCRPVKCERPEAPHNWAWVHPQDECNTIHPAHLRCADGYQSNQAALDGMFSVTCNADGSLATMPDPCVPATYIVTGHAKNAVNPVIKIPGAVITIIETGETIVANNVGYYTLSLSEGTHHYTVTADGFISLENGQVTINGPGTHDVLMSPVMVANSWRLVLEWSDAPRDLDSHLIFKGHEWFCPEVYYGRPRQTCNGVSVSLDWDEMWGHGPETVTLEGVNQCEESWTTTCKWVYKVKNWTGYQWMVAGEGWVRSEARVKLYTGDTMVREFEVNADHGYKATHGGYESSFSEGDYYWSVFSLDSHGNVAECTNADCN